MPSNLKYFKPLILIFSLAFVAGAQEPQQPASTAPQPVLENSGKPMVVPFRCSDEDIRSAGLSCTEEEPCETFLELTAASQSGNRIIVAGNIHTESATIFSVLLTSEDGGRSWTEPQDRIRASGFDRIQFFDADTGWVVGQELFPIPQNPFLLLTDDGGKTWRKREIFN